jgi:hypothetical protein
MGTIPLRDDGLGTAVTTDPRTSGCFDDPEWNLESLRNFRWNPKQTFCKKSWPQKLGHQGGGLSTSDATRQSAYV